MAWEGVELLIFDLDYTLIDSSAGIVYCFNETRRRAGEAEVEPERIAARIGLPIEETFKLYGSKDPQARREQFRKLAREGAMAERSFLLPGVAETLAALQARGYRMAVASTKSRAEIVAILAHLKISDYFEAVCGSDEVLAPKPAPDPLLKVMRETRVLPEKTVYVGDHVVDVRAAKAAGVRVIALEGGPCPREEVLKEKPDRLLSRFNQLLELMI